MYLLVILSVVLIAGAALLTIEAVTRLRQLYAQGEAQHWGRLAEQVNLLHGHTEQGTHVLEGRRSDVWLHVAADGGWLVVRGRIDVSVPRGIRIRHRRSRRAGALKLGHPLLDSTLHVEGPPDAVRLLQDPHLVAPMMGVVHAWPESFVDDRYVVLRYPDPFGRDLEARCRDVIDLVVGLRAAWTRLQAPDAPR